jgi:hypothetical protein
VPAHLQPYAYAQGAPPPPYYQSYPQQPMTPGAMYQMHSQPLPPTLTAQMRLFEVDELPPQFKLGESRRRWFMYIVAGMIAISTAAVATFLIIKLTREDPAPQTASIIVESVPPGADVFYDGKRLSGTTPMTIDLVPLGTKHEIRVALPKHKHVVQTVDIPKAGGDQRVTAKLEPITGRIVINTAPGGAEVWINNQQRGRTPTTINDVDMETAKKLELRLKDHVPRSVDLVWPADGIIKIDVPLQR